jgi:hypothetical protein
VRQPSAGSAVSACSAIPEAGSRTRGRAVPRPLAGRMRPAAPAVKLWLGRDPLLLSPCRRSRPSVPTPRARHAPCCRCSGETRGETWATAGGSGGRSRLGQLANLHAALRRRLSRRTIPAAAQPRARPHPSAAPSADTADSARHRGRAMPGGGGSWGRNTGPARGREVPPPATTTPSRSVLFLPARGLGTARPRVRDPPRSLLQNCQCTQDTSATSCPSPLHPDPRIPSRCRPSPQHFQQSSHSE